MDGFRVCGCFGCCRLDTAARLHADDNAKPSNGKAWDFAALKREVAEVEAACAKTESPTVFSHNDLLAGNIMVPSEVSQTVSLPSMY